MAYAATLHRPCTDLRLAGVRRGQLRRDAWCNGLGARRVETGEFTLYRLEADRMTSSAAVRLTRSAGA